MIEQRNIPNIKTIQDLREVMIPTATAIICQRENPHMVLIGTSIKHEKPVLPGGKIDQKDIVSSELERCATCCIRRELAEEIGTTLEELQLLKVSKDSSRDMRKVSVRSLQGSLVESLTCDLSEDMFVLGCYGCPDYLFIAKIDTMNLTDTEELKKLTWIDCRTILPDSLAAGHSAYIIEYCRALTA